MQLNGDNCARKYYVLNVISKVNKYAKQMQPETELTLIAG